MTKSSFNTEPRWFVACVLPPARLCHGIAIHFTGLQFILGGDLLSIEYRDGESQRVEITPGQVEWEQPSARVHRAVNVGKRPYEQITVFLLDRPDAEPQPMEE